MILDLLSSTPLYVYWIFFSFLFVGIIQTKKREQGITKALAIPFVLIFFSIYAFIQDFGIDTLSLFSWIGGMVFVVIMNTFIKSQNNVKYSSSNKVFIIDGSYLPLFMMMLLFFTKYSVTALNISGSSVIGTSFYIILACLLYGIFTGMYLMRFFILIYKMQK